MLAAFVLCPFASTTFFFFAELKAIGKPFTILCPCTTMTTKYFSKHFADEIQIIVPSQRIHLEKLVDGKTVENYKSRCNFDSSY